MEKTHIIILLVVTLLIVTSFSGCIQNTSAENITQLGTLDVQRFTFDSGRLGYVWVIIGNEQETMHLTVDEQPILLESSRTDVMDDFGENDIVMVTGYTHYIMSRDVNYKCLEIKNIEVAGVYSAPHTTVVTGSGSYSAGGGLNLTGAIFSLNGNIWGNNLVWDGTFVNASSSMTPYNQDLNTSDSPTFADITLTNHPNLDTDSTDDFDGNYSNLTNRPNNFSSDDLSDNDTDDLSEGSSNLYCSLNNIRTRLSGQWIDINNLTVNSEEITSTKIGHWDTAYGWGDHSGEGYLTSISGNASTELTDTANILYETELDDESELEGQLSDVSDVFTNNDGTLADDDLSDNDTDDLSEGASNFWCTLSRIKTLLSNDFHNIGGTDNDTHDTNWDNLTNVPAGFQDGIDNTGGAPYNQDLNTSDDAIFNKVTAGSFWGDGGNLTNISSGTIYNQDLNSTDSPTFKDITVSDYPNLDKDSTDDFDGDYTSLTNRPSNFTSDDLSDNSSTELSDTADLLYESELDDESELEGQLADVSDVFTNNDGTLSDDDLSDNDTDDLSEGSVNFWCDLARIQSLIKTSWLDLNNLTVNGESVTSTLIGQWNTAFGWGSNIFNQDLNSTNSPTFDDITLTSYPNLDKDSTDDISLDTGNLTYAHNDTFIKNSNGFFGLATESNLQLAIDNLDNESGWVELPVVQIDLDDQIKIGDGCWLRGQGNGSVLRLNDNVNKTVITNYNAGSTYFVVGDPTTPNYNIKITDLVIEANGLNQPEWWTIGGAETNQVNLFAHGIRLHNVFNTTIKDVTVNNTAASGILLEYGNRAYVENCHVSNAGKLYADSGNDYDMYYTWSFHAFNVSNSTFSACKVYDSYGNGFCVEGQNLPGLARKYWAENCVIENCYVYNATYGYYFEYAQNCMLTDSTAFDCRDTRIYGGAGGLKFASSVTDNIIVTGCIFDGGKTVVGNSGGTNITIDNCVIQNGDQYGIDSDGGDGLYVSNCRFYGSNSGVMRINSCKNNSIFNNYLWGGAYWGTAISLASVRDSLVMFNHFIEVRNNEPYDGIKESGTSDGNVIVFNKFSGSLANNEITITGGNTRVNCTGFDDWNFYPGVS